jgi:hypothetical protein
MSQITLNLDGEALREATTQAILGVLTPEVKAKILESAVQAVLKPSTNSWDRGKSPLESAFEQAVMKVATKEAERLVCEDEAMKERIQDLLRKTADKVLSADMEALAERMAQAFAASMRRD